MAKSVQPKVTRTCEKLSQSACQNLPYFKSYAGKDYCVLHYPATDKIEIFRLAIRDKLDKADFNFREVWFPEAADFSNTPFSANADFYGAAFSSEADFSGATFSAIASFLNTTFMAEAYFNKSSFLAFANFCSAAFAANVNFSHINFPANARFLGATFAAEADFGNTTFSAEADFASASFTADANFRSARFEKNANFSSATFKRNVNFYLAAFAGDANFDYATFEASALFHSTGFKSYVRFSGKAGRKALGVNPRLDFQFARIEKPERVSFHALNLRPHWFINVDSRKFEFIDVDWNYRLKEELESTREAKIRAPHSLLSRAFRQLAVNAEEMHRYRQASRLRFHAFEARRIEKYHGFVPWRLNWWYWLVSGYGESVGRAFLVFVALLALFTLFYKYCEFVPSAPITAPPATMIANTAPPPIPDLAPKRQGWRESALYSFNVSILQKPEPKPKGLWPSFLVSLETVLGPAQAALLALTVRRRFMR